MKPEVPSPAHRVGRKSRPATAPSHRGEFPSLDAERQRLQVQRFQALNALAEGLSHELGNLLAGIINSAELAAMDLPEGHPSHESLKNLFVASYYARDFAHRLAAFGRRSAPVRKLVRLQSVVEECLQILRTIIPAKVEVRAQLQPECPPIHADAAQLHQAILDVCLYSWQGLADRGGQIQINQDLLSKDQPEAGQPSRLCPGQYVRLTIQDTSPGLPNTEAEKMFRPFGPRRASGAKVGLELFAVRETIQEHQGEIRLETEPGQGLKFLIYLPVATNSE